MAFTFLSSTDLCGCAPSRTAFYTPSLSTVETGQLEDVVVIIQYKGPEYMEGITDVHG